MSRVKSRLTLLQKILVLERGACHSEEERKGHWPDSHTHESSWLEMGGAERSVNWIGHSKGGKAV